jgi:hypothetical protein
MTTFLNIGFDGSNFSTKIEFDNIILNIDNKNVFITDVDDSNIIKFKFDLKNEPRKTICQDSDKIIELKNMLIQNGYVDRGTTLLYPHGSHQYLYVF